MTQRRRVSKSPPIGAKQQRQARKCLLVPDATPNPTEPDRDSRRVAFQRDRDRVVWSFGFRRLAEKTQVFPPQYGDHHRRRLTHSVEVMQLSTSIARSLGLNDILCEAIALAHDLGHPPFGHAGEHALNNALQRLRCGSRGKRRSSHLPQKLKRFTHYEHGLDIVTYLEPYVPSAQSGTAGGTRYQPVSGCGMRLTHDTCVGIPAHTFWLNETKQERNKFGSWAFLRKHTKHAQLFSRPAKPSPEAQVVRMCDKLSYLLTDIEDGLSLGALHLADLKDADLPGLESSENPPLKGPSGAHIEHRLFLQERNKVLGAFLRSTVDCTAKRLNEKKRHRLCVELNEDLKTVLGNVWKRLQQGRLFRHPVVAEGNRRGRHVVSCLFCQYLRNPELIPWHFRGRFHGGNDLAPVPKGLYKLKTRKVKLNFTYWWRRRRQEEGVACGEKPLSGWKDIGWSDVIAAKDYVAGMTDSFALLRFREDVRCPVARDVAKKNQWLDGFHIQ